MKSTRPTFDSGFDRVVGRAGDVDAVFGRDVLSALIEPLREAAAKPRTERRWGPGVLGCAMWMDDAELIDVLGRMANACIVITKQQRNKYNKPEFALLEGLAERTGLAQSAYPELSEVAPAVDGEPLVVGPFSRIPEDTDIGAVRELGFRRSGNRLVPIVHAKILLLGQMCWTDEHPSGYMVDTLYFEPERLWIGSANFTKSSRDSLEMGMWTADQDLLEAARAWLLDLVKGSEQLRSTNDESAPELVPVSYDDAAILEYMRDVRPMEPDQDGE